MTYLDRPTLATVLCMHKTSGKVQHSDQGTVLSSWQPKVSDMSISLSYQRCIQATCGLQEQIGDAVKTGLDGKPVLWCLLKCCSMRFSLSLLVSETVEN